MTSSAGLTEFRIANRFTCNNLDYNPRKIKIERKLYVTNVCTRGHEIPCILTIYLILTGNLYALIEYATMSMVRRNAGTKNRKFLLLFTSVRKT